MESSNILLPVKYTVLFIVLILLQVLVCNNILLFSVAMPFVFIYFILVLPLDVSLNIIMILAFFMGFLIDLFSDTLGLNCLACLLLSVFRKPVFYLYIPKEDKFLNSSPSIISMGWFNYFKYSLTLSAIYCFLVFGIELFSFASFGRILVMALSSTVLTLLLVIATDVLFKRN